MHKPDKFRKKEKLHVHANNKNFNRDTTQQPLRKEEYITAM